MTKKEERPGGLDAENITEATVENPPAVKKAGKKEKKGACVYCGPSIRNVTKQFTVYAEGKIPDALALFIKEHPETKNLLVPIEQFAAIRKRLQTVGTAEAILYNKIRSEL